MDNEIKEQKFTIRISDIFGGEFKRLRETISIFSYTTSLIKIIQTLWPAVSVNLSTIMI